MCKDWVFLEDDEFYTVELVEDGFVYDFTSGVVRYWMLLGEKLPFFDTWVMIDRDMDRVTFGVRTYKDFALSEFVAEEFRQKVETAIDMEPVEEFSYVVSKVVSRVLGLLFGGDGEEVEVEIVCNEYDDGGFERELIVSYGEEGCSICWNGAEILVDGSGECIRRIMKCLGGVYESSGDD